MANTLTYHLRSLGYELVQAFDSYISDQVALVQDADGNYYVVKHDLNEQRLSREFRVMQNFSKVKAAPRVSLLTPTTMRMEYLGKTSLRDDMDTSHLVNVAAMIKLAHRASIAEDVPDLISYLAEHDHQIMVHNPVIGTEMVNLAERAFSKMQQDQSEKVMLHADLHAKNIILTPHGAQMIDPYGRLGPAIYDLVMVACCNWEGKNWAVMNQLLEYYPQPQSCVEAWFTWNTLKRLYVAIAEDFPVERHWQAAMFCQDTFANALS